jgi:hypothetical protein
MRLIIWFYLSQNEAAFKTKESDNIMVIICHGTKWLLVIMGNWLLLRNDVMKKL